MTFAVIRSPFLMRLQNCSILQNFQQIVGFEEYFFSNSTSQHQNLYAVSNQITSKTIFAMFVALE